MQGYGFDVFVRGGQAMYKDMAQRIILRLSFTSSDYRLVVGWAEVEGNVI